MDKVISVTEAMKLRFQKQGTAFIIVGVIGLITEQMNLAGTIEIVVQIVKVILAATVVLLCIKTMRVNCEEFDEMAEENFYKAKARARDVGIVTLMIMVYGTCAIYLVTKNFGIDFTSFGITPVEFFVNMLFIYLGVNDLIVGREFAALEEE